MKVLKKDYPWTIVIEDKIGRTSGKMYQSISIGFTSVKDKDAKDSKDKYKTEWLNFFDEKDLLKLSSTAENAYQRLNYEREKEKAARKNAAPAQTQPVAQPTQQPVAPAAQSPDAYPELDDDPFRL